MTNLVEMIAKSLVDQPEKVVVTKEERDGDTLIVLQVASNDMGKVIGKQGRIAKALRTVVKAAAGKDEAKVNVDIISDEEAAVAKGQIAKDVEDAARAVSDAGEAPLE